MHTAIRIYAIVAFLLVPGAAFAQQDSQQKQGVPEAELAAQLLDRAEATFATFNAKPKFQNVINRARAVLIIPKLTRAGILVGIKGGSGVLFAQDMNTGEWSAPAFYRAFSASVGVQIGVEEAQAAFAIMSERALEGVLAGDFQFGSDASVTIGSGDNVAAKSDVYSFTLVEGLFGGISLEGVEVTANSFRNRAFYGERLTARDIVTDPAVTNSAADKVRVAMRGERYKAAQARKEADRLALERAQTLANKSAEIGVRKTDQGIAFVMSGSVLFDTASAELQPGAFAKLEPLVGFLREFKDRKIEIAGHTDSVGSAAYNFTLSKKRADAVKLALFSKGVTPERMIARGYGEDVPVATNATPEGRQQNRRVEIVLKQAALTQ